MPISAAASVQDPHWTSFNELYRVFGKSSVDRWADVENTANRENIRERIIYAMEWATVEAKSRLTGSPAGTIIDPPVNLRYAVTQLAGVQLYTARGVKDNGDDREGRHRLLQHKRDVDKFFQRVHAGQLRLQNCTPTVTYPVAVAPETYHVPSRSYLTPEQTQDRNDLSEKLPVTNIVPEGQFSADQV